MVPELPAPCARRAPVKKMRLQKRKIAATPRENVRIKKALQKPVMYGPDVNRI
jgi:hypothetical protein